MGKKTFFILGQLALDRNGEPTFDEFYYKTKSKALLAMKEAVESVIEDYYYQTSSGYIDILRGKISTLIVISVPKNPDSQEICFDDRINHAMNLILDDSSDCENPTVCENLDILHCTWWYISEEQLN